MTRPQLRRVLLVGFMGAGKTTVGRRVADRLRWRFIDFDDVVEAEAGTSIAELFRTGGEARFRELEHEVARRLLREEEVVLGSGGGWAAAPGRLDSMPAGTATFWLKVSAETAVERANMGGGRRPLLEGPDPVATAAELLEGRTPSYGRARWTVDTEHSTVEDVSARILGILGREFPEQALNER